MRFFTLLPAWGVCFRLDWFRQRLNVDWLQRRFGVEVNSTTIGIAIAVILGVVLLAVMVGRGRQPIRAPERLGEEPTISLYVADSGETKHIKMEEYVAGVVAGEINNDWPKAALETQAVLARTFTLQKMSNGKTDHGTDASTDPKEFQAYAAQNINDAIRQAVQATRGRIITHRGEPIRAWFHSCAGGITATAMEGLGFNEEPTPYIKVARDPACDDPAKQRWTTTFSGDEVSAAARKLGAEVDGFENIRIEERGPSGRATRLAIGAVTVSAPSLRIALGPERMRSTLLDSVQVEGDRVTMKGRGWGHGVGLSQFGALEKARRGWDAERIINHYFDNIRIEGRWR